MTSLSVHRAAPVPLKQLRQKVFAAMAQYGPWIKALYNKANVPALKKEMALVHLM